MMATSDYTLGLALDLSSLILGGLDDHLVLVASHAAFLIKTSVASFIAACLYHC